MGIDLPDWGEIVAALKGDKEPLKEAWKSLFRSIHGERDELRDKLTEELRTLGAEALLEELWPACPAWLKPLILSACRAVVSAIITKLGG